MKLIIVGCGRVGAELAFATKEKGHEVCVVDRSAEAFARLNAGETPFHGRTVQGDVLHHDVLLRAGIETADGLAAVTPDDPTNLVVSRIACEIYHVPHVVARVYDPRRLPDFEALGIQSVASSSWAAGRVELLLTHPGIAPLNTIGHGEVLLLDVSVPSSWVGDPVERLHVPGEYQPVALIRAGQALLVNAGAIFQEDDLVVLAVARDALPALEAALHGEGIDNK